MLLRALVSLSFACGTSHPADPPDAGSADAGTERPDAGEPVPDAGTPAPDAGPGKDCSACDVGRACLRGVCIDTCGADPMVFDAELAPDLVPVANVCLILPPGPFAAHGRAGAIELAHAQIEAMGSDALAVIERYTASIVGPVDVEPGRRCTTRYRGTPSSTPQLLEGAGLSPSGALFHFAIASTTTSGPFGNRAFVVSEDCDVSQFDRSPGYDYGGVLLNERAADLILTGRIGMESGLVRGSELAGSGAGYGSVQRFEDRVVAVAFTGHGQVWLNWFSARALETGPYPVSATLGDLSDSSAETMFVAIDGHGIVGRALSTEEHVLFLRLEDGALVPGRSFFASSRFTRVIPVDGSTQAILQHEDGLLVVR
jgi:hypothetical protein